jgi:hypothetical protein
MAIINYNLTDLSSGEAASKPLVDETPNKIYSTGQKIKKGVGAYADFLGAGIDAYTAPTRDFAAAMPTMAASGLVGLGSLFSGTTPEGWKPGDPPPTKANTELAERNIQTIQQFVAERTGPQTKAGAFTSEMTAKPFEWLDKYAAKPLGNLVQDLTGSPGLAASTVAAVDVGVPMLVGGGVKRVWNSTPVRMARIPERGMTLPSWEQVQKANPGISQGELLRKYPAYKTEAAAMRNAVEVSKPGSAPAAPVEPAKAASPVAPVEPVTPTAKPTTTSLTKKQQANVLNRVAELGSVEAVKAAYPKSDSLALDAYAVELAEAAEAQGLFASAEVPTAESAVAPPVPGQPLGLPAPKPPRQVPAMNELPAGAPIQLGMTEKPAVPMEQFVPQEPVAAQPIEPVELSEPPLQGVDAELEALGADLMTKNGEQFWKAKLSNGKTVRIPQEKKNGAENALTKLKEFEQQIADVKAVPTFTDEALAKAENYQLNPRKFSDVTSAQNFLKSAGSRADLAGGQLELIKVGDRYRAAQKVTPEPELVDDDFLDDDFDIDTSNLKKAMSEYEEGARTYDTKALANKPSSQVMAKAPEPVMAELTMKQSQATRRDAIKAAAEKTKTKKQLTPEEEIQQILDSDPDAYDPEMQSWEELKQLDQEKDYYDQVEEIEGRLGRTVRDLTDLFSDERGALGKDVSKLKRSLKEVAAELNAAKRKVIHLGYDETTAAAEAIGEGQQKVKAAAASGDVTEIPQVVEELTTVKEVLKDVAGKAKVKKDMKKAEEKTVKKVKLSEAEAAYYANLIKQQMEIDLDRAFNPSVSPIKDLVDYMKSIDRIVPKYKQGSFEVPKRQKPAIPKDSPEMLDPSKDLMRIGSGRASTTSGHLLTPSFALRKFFKPGTSLIIDAMESTMALGTNIRNTQRWAKDTFGKLPSATQAIEQTLGKLYEETRKGLDKSDQLKAEVGQHSVRRKDAEKMVKLNERRLANTHAAHPKIPIYKAELVKAQMAVAKYKAQATAAGKRYKNLRKATMENLVNKYDKMIVPLAEKNPRVRVALAAAGKLPKGISLSPAEAMLAEKATEYFEATATRMRELGLPTKEDGAYITHSFGEIATDKWAKAFKYVPSVPIKLKFASQVPYSRVWLPDINQLLDHYIPTVERKLAFQPLLDRWSDFIEYQAPPNMREMMQDWLKSNLYKEHGGLVNKVVNGVVNAEYVRLVGLSLSTAAKHASKLLDTFGVNTMSATMQGMYQTSKLPLQATAKMLGMKGDTPELDLFKAYVSMDQIVRVLDETPGLKSSWSLVKALSGSLTTTTEMLDNGVTIMATTIASANAKLTVDQARALVLDSILKANFRGGVDQPLYMKNPAGRLLGMFQTTVQKTFELRASLLKDQWTGGKDAFGKSKRNRLLRYTLMVGAVTALFRSEGKDILHWFTEAPYMRDWLHGTKEFPYYATAMPKTAASPPVQLLTEMNQKGVLEGAKEHFDYTPIVKYLTMQDNDYPNKYYDTPTDQIFGLRKLDAGHAKKQSGRARIKSRKRPKR